MIYLEKFVFPGSDDEFNFFNNYHLNCHKSYYPFQILTKHNFTQIDFEPVTILCGSNGCGKSTALNIIAENSDFQETAHIQEQIFSRNIQLFALMFQKFILCPSKAELLQATMFLTVCLI